MYAYTAGSCSGSPHSSHSVTVSGSDGSRIEVSASTNGTCATIPANASGARFTAAPISRPPADPPRATSPPGDVQPAAARCRAHATKSVKVLALRSIFPFVVPAAAQFAAAADVRDRVHEAALQQGQPGDGEPGVHRDLVAAVPVQHARRGAVPRGAAPAHQRHRHPGAVRGGGPLPVLLVRGRLVGPRARQRAHRRAAAQQQLPGGHVAVVHRVRGHQRRVVQPVQRGGRLEFPPGETV